MNNIILKASAGTGKTYRLSLEFIANLIRGVNYKNIVVMTFTKKATAEIKERIYDFLHQIAFDEGNGTELEKNLKEDLFTTKQGGGDNAGTTLNDRAHELINAYRQLQNDIEDFADKRFKELFLKKDGEKKDETNDKKK